MNESILVYFFYPKFSVFSKNTDEQRFKIYFKTERKKETLRKAIP